MTARLKMAESFWFSVNAVFPLFIIVFAGWLIKRLGLLSDSFFAESDRLVFKLALPALLFKDVATSGSGVKADANLILFCVIGITATVLISCIIVPFFIKDNPSRSSFIQGIYRSNFAILGIPLAESMFGSEGKAVIAMVIPFAITLFNSYAVVIFSVFAPEDKKLKSSVIIRKIILNIIKNPLIIAVVLAMPFLLFKIELPYIADKCISYISSLSLPLALMSIGAGFTFTSMKTKLPKIITATLLKIVVVPAIFVAAALFLGFRGAQLGIIFILFGGPCAVSGYIMAKNMGGDYELTGHISLLTTLFCIATMFLGIFSLRLFNLI